MKFFTFRGIGLFFLVSLLVAIVINVRISYQADTDMEFILTNVEALAQGEGDGGGNGCYGPGTVDCNGRLYAWKQAR